ncbi:MAG: DeoR/GlpR family DNA-binding transcription regulator [Catenisphaera adipataccumulans]|jgi:DeoR/GlpR family transcriptional regulator of sugar metabolism|uniref:DeoR/GlpR family DNA-binding transcription regulator n=1 Tax=Catenisphaera adipataccumulans TaxID=700500 RepID=UPI003D8A12C2
MLAAERRQAILKQLDQHEIVTVQKLAAHLDVTPMTIRRDLAELEEEERCVRVHGGAKRIEPGVLSKHTEMDMLDRLHLHYEAKVKVAKKAAELIQDGECIFIDGGTSMLPLMPFIKDKAIQIVTNNLLWQTQFESDRAEVFALGGKLIPKYKMTVGPETAENLRRFRFDRAFISCNGFSIKRDLMYTADVDTMAVKEQALRQAETGILLTDASKANVQGFYSLLKLSAFDAIVCDRDTGTREAPEGFILV